MLPHYRILSVEDDDDTAAMISGLLGLINCEVVVASSFAEAVDKITTEQFDLHLLDNWLPGGSGTELCRKIREIDQTTPIVLYTGAAYDSDRQEALEAGAQAYLVKPADIDKLVETVKRLLAQRE
jgi:DNA-binding response OmpR family regulator